MKLIYQQMLTFFIIIMTSAAIIGYSVLSFASDQAYNTTFSRLEGYANSMGEIALSKDPKTGTYKKIDANFLNELQKVMRDDDVTVRVFDEQNEQVYPESRVAWRLPASTWKQLEKGKRIHIRNDHQTNSPQLSSKDAYSWVLVPWFDGKKLRAVVWIGSKVTNVEEPVNNAKNNLISALIISMVVGLILSYILAYFNVSRIKRLQQATRKVAAGNFNVHIQHRHNDEIDDLAGDFNTMTDSLKKSQDEIERQEERRDQFMADAAHEMRTPLTTINGILEGLKYDAIPVDSKDKSLDLMGNETKRLIRLVNENLDYEKIRNNKTVLIENNFNSMDVLNNIKTQLQQKADAAGDELNLIGDEKVMVYADHDRFTQIIFNLVQNAIQFTKKGKIDIIAARVEHGAQFQVRDNGIGMTDKQKHFIFDRYYKADPSRQKLGTGESGLGLAIVHSLVQRHGGEIDLNTEFHLGTTFTVTLYDEGYQKKSEKNTEKKN